MTRLKTIKLKNIKVFLKKIPLVLGKNAFLAFWGLFILSLILGLLVFYRYHIFTKEPELKITEKQLQFKTKTYQEILGTWQEKEERFRQTDSKKYPNPFIP